MTANRCEMTTKRINTLAKMHKTTTERKITQVITERRERPQRHKCKDAQNDYREIERKERIDAW